MKMKRNEIYDKTHELIRHSLFQTTTSLPRPPPPKKKRVGASVRASVWSIHHGNRLRATCSLCEKRMIDNNCKNGWETAHIVARAHCTTGAQATDVYNMVPSCATCNNDMSTQCLWDWLVAKHRIDAMRTLATRLFEAYTQEIGGSQRPMCAVFRELYGKHVHNERVWDYLRKFHYELLRDRRRALIQELEAVEALIHENCIQ